MRIAMIGQRGLPAAHGGVEHHVQQLGSRLAARGHEVVVYTRPSYSDPTLDSFMMRLKSIADPPHLDAITHSFRAHDSRTRFDSALSRDRSVFTSPLRVNVGKIVATIHARTGGGERTRSQHFQRGAGRDGLRVPDATISVSRVLTELYRSQGATSVHHILNGVSVSPMMT
jgi:hypothetical protein